MTVIASLLTITSCRASRNVDTLFICNSSTMKKSSPTSTPLKTNGTANSNYFPQMSIVAMPPNVEFGNSKHSFLPLYQVLTILFPTYYGTNLFHRPNSTSIYFANPPFTQIFLPGNTTTGRPTLMPPLWAPSDAPLSFTTDRSIENCGTFAAAKSSELAHQSTTTTVYTSTTE